MSVSGEVGNRKGQFMATYHSKNGRFSSAASAYSMSKEGDRYKVVRQHRRIGPSKKGKSKRQTAAEAVQRTNLARQKAALTGALTGPGWVNVNRVFEAVSGRL